LKKKTIIRFVNVETDPRLLYTLTVSSLKIIKKTNSDQQAKNNLQPMHNPILFADRRKQ
jgi:hypothetical protein